MLINIKFIFTIVGYKVVIQYTNMELIKDIAVLQHAANMKKN